jgi:Cdc6-like AAA superfamily ATPase
MALLSSLDSFGGVAAENDAVLDYFLSTNAVDEIIRGNVLVVLGRKGTGKTAIVRYLTETQGGQRAKSLSLRGYPWNVHAARVDRGASPVEAYVSSWRYLVAVELAAVGSVSV